MASEITQRQRAEAHVSYMFGVPDYEIATGEYENAIQATLKLQATARQEALREARQSISRLFDENQSGTPEYYCALLDAGNELDRLAREGVR